MSSTRPVRQSYLWIRMINYATTRRAQSLSKVLFCCISASELRRSIRKKQLAELNIFSKRYMSRVSHSRFATRDWASQSQFRTTNEQTKQNTKCGGTTTHTIIISSRQQQQQQQQQQQRRIEEESKNKGSNTV